MIVFKFFKSMKKNTLPTHYKKMLLFFLSFFTTCSLKKIQSSKEFCFSDYKIQEDKMQEEMLEDSIMEEENTYKSLSEDGWSDISMVQEIENQENTEEENFVQIFEPLTLEKVEKKYNVLSLENKFNILCLSNKYKRELFDLMDKTVVNKEYYGQILQFLFQDNVLDTCKKILESSSNSFLKSVSYNYLLWDAKSNFTSHNAQEIDYGWEIFQSMVHNICNKRESSNFDLLIFYISHELVCCRTVLTILNFFIPDTDRVHIENELIPIKEYNEKMRSKEEFIYNYLLGDFQYDKDFPKFRKEFFLEKNFLSEKIHDQNRLMFILNKELYNAIEIAISHPTESHYKELYFDMFKNYMEEKNTCIRTHLENKKLCLSDAKKAWNIIIDYFHFFHGNNADAINEWNRQFHENRKKGPNDLEINYFSRDIFYFLSSYLFDEFSLDIFERENFNISLFN